ncbi:jg24653 [Pararge aegeria aegeria]|uniref:Jg24653 protein n=1 Tax=Pararge aegeria aegeria TaxID=348720 RepID=A0A8S4RPR8_9NEOP|nr:jg24653 [Pararge aegeria aegeria]
MVVAYRSENRWVSRFWNGDLAPENAALVDYHELDRRHEVSWKQAARTAEFGTLYKRPMSSSGRSSFEVIIQNFQMAD